MWDLCIGFTVDSIVVPEEVKRCCLFALRRTVVPEEGKRCCLFALCKKLLFLRRAKCLFLLTTFYVQKQRR